LLFPTQKVFYMESINKRLIVLIDFSEYSNTLLRYAYSWCGRINARLLLVHQTTVLAPGMAGKEDKEELAVAANEEAVKKMRVLADYALNTEEGIEYYASEKDMETILDKLLKESFSQLVLLGLKGTGILKKLFIGSVAVQVIESIENVAVAIPKNIGQFSPEKIYVAISEKYPLNDTRFREFLEFVKSETKKVVFISLAGQNDDIIEVRSYLQDMSTRYADIVQVDYDVYQGDNVYSNLKNIISNKSNELLVVQKGSQLYSNQLFKKFLINELVYEGDTPLVVLP